MKKKSGTIAEGFLQTLGLKEGTRSTEKHKGDTRPKMNYGIGIAIGIGKGVAKVKQHLPEEDH